MSNTETKKVALWIPDINKLVSSNKISVCATVNGVDMAPHWHKLVDVDVIIDLDQIQPIINQNIERLKTSLEKRIREDTEKLKRLG